MAVRWLAHFPSASHRLRHSRNQAQRLCRFRREPPLAGRGMTPNEYRTKWGLPQISDFPHSLGRKRNVRFRASDAGKWTLLFQAGSDPRRTPLSHLSESSRLRP